jgi:cobalt-zinc-cadmium efflux system outer membrane protein
LYLRSQSADTLALSLQDAEKTFIERNMSLLAAKYELEASKAQEVQARLLDNPNFYFEQSIYNQYSKRYFPTQTKYSDGSLGQNQMNVNQLFSIAGKRNKRLKLAKMSTQAAQYQFYDLSRTLLYQLRTSFYDLYFAQKINSVFLTQIADLEKNAAAFKEQVDKGNVSLSEYLRLVSFVNSLKAERLENVMALNEAGNTLHVMLGDTSSKKYKALLDESLISAFDPQSLNLKQLLDTAVNNRADVKVQESITRQEKANLEYQKAVGVPDLMIAGTYDRNGSYIPNYYGVGVGFQLPAFNRNQGNIKASEARLKERLIDEQYYKLNVQQDVMKAYQTLLETGKFYRSTDRSMIDKFPAIMKGLSENYMKRNISVIEFIDYYESFKDNLIRMNQTSNSFYNSIENLNYEVGKTIIR